MGTAKHLQLSLGRKFIKMSTHYPFAKKRHSDRLMKTLYVGFTKSSKRFAPFSWLVSKAQKTEYSHVRLRWVNSTQTPIIYEASGSSVQFIGPMIGLTLSSKVYPRFSFELNYKPYKELVRICMTYAGVQYSIKQVINIGLNNLGIKWQPFRRDLEYA